MQRYDIAEHAPSLLPDGKRWRLVWSDEFDGTQLDRSKWDFRLHIMQSRHETYTTQGVTLDGNSCVHLNLIEKDGQYYSPHLQTGYNFMDLPPETGYGKFTWPVGELKPQRFTHSHGYYECRCRLQRQPGWWSAFWLQSPKIGCSLNPEEDGVEIDIMESFQPGRVIPHCLHWNGYGRNYRTRNTTGHTPPFLPEEQPALDDGFHWFGVDWSDRGYTFYIDGRQDGVTLDGPVSMAQQFLLISTECKGYRNGDTPDPELLQAILPDDFVVDHVRVFDEIRE